MPRAGLATATYDWVVAQYSHLGVVTVVLASQLVAVGVETATPAGATQPPGAVP